MGSSPSFFLSPIPTLTTIINKIKLKTIRLEDLLKAGLG